MFEINNNSTTIRTNIEPSTHDSKPKYVGTVINQTSSPESINTIGLKSFAESVSIEGKSFYQGVMNGRTDADWGQEQYLFAVDIDNSDDSYPFETVESLLSKFREKGIDIFLIYESFSSTEAHKKYRVVIVSDEPFTDSEETKNVIDALLRISPQADKSCRNLARIFFGSNKGWAYIDCVVNSKYKLLSLVDKMKSIDDKTAQMMRLYEKEKENATRTYNIDSQLTKDIESFDLAGFIAKDTNQGAIPNNEGYRFHYCPICGHYDDLSVSTEKNLFFCHSVNGNKGGNILNYLMLTRIVDIEHARRMFDSIRNGTFKDYLSQPIVESHVPNYIVQQSNGQAVNYILLGKHMREKYSYYIVKDSSGKRDIMWYINGIYVHVEKYEVQEIIKAEIDIYDFTLSKLRVIEDTYNYILIDSKDKTVYREQLEESDATENLIAFENGVLDITTMTLMPFSPDYFITNKIPCNWNENADECVFFNKYMQTFSNGSKETIKLLLQFIGLALSNVKVYKTKKALFLLGDGDTGKSVFKSFVERLVGAENCSNVSLEALEERFALSGIMGKRLVGASDMDCQTLRTVKNFKSLTGGDRVYSDVKCDKPVNFKFNGLLIFSTNQMPNILGDNGDWVYNRMIIVKCTNIIPESERDPYLLEKLYKEREAIVVMAVKALKELIDNNFKFNMPDSCIRALKEYKYHNNNVSHFVDECCEPTLVDDKNLMTKVTELYKAYIDWCTFYNYAPVVQKTFKESVSTIFKLDMNNLIVRKSDNNYYRIALTNNFIELRDKGIIG